MATTNLWVWRDDNNPTPNMRISNGKTEPTKCRRKFQRKPKGDDFSTGPTDRPEKPPLTRQAKPKGITSKYQHITYSNGE